MKPPLPLDDLTEKEWTAQAVQLATMLGWRRYHTWRSKHSAPGWPDEAWCRDRLILAELKMQGKKPSPAQAEWLDALTNAGQECYLLWPSDLDDLARILGRRWSHEDGLLFAETGALTQWQPHSLWLPGIGRADTQHQQAA